MSIVTALRDYIELLNNVYDSLSGNITIQTVIQQSLLYLFASIKYCVIYVISFQWFRDLCYLPIIIPQISVALLKGQFFLESPFANFFTFLEPATFSTNPFLIGFLNSFFLSLPFSFAHLVFARRLFFHGEIAAGAAGLGIILGHISFLACVLFGVRFFIIPWFSFEPLTYILGFFLMVRIIYEIGTERVIRRIRPNQTDVLIRIFLLNFALIWTEQVSVFQYLGNLTLSAEPTILENFASKNQIHYLITHFSYLFGILIGHCFFMVVSAVVLKGLYRLVQERFFPLHEGTWRERLNFGFGVTLMALAITSIPYYTADYLLLKPLGFISRDKTFENTPFDPTGPRDTIGQLGGSTYQLSLSTDPTLFGRGRYLKPNQIVSQNFEDLNYQGEYAWTTRFDRDTGNAFPAENAKAAGKKLISRFLNIDLEPKLDSSRDPDLSENEWKKQPKPNIISPIRKRFLAQYIDNNVRTFPFNDLTTVQFTRDFFFSPANRSTQKLEKLLKEKYYSNPVCQFLLSIDIDNFLIGQPKNYRLTPQEEANLIEKRVALANYYDSLRFYTNVRYADAFQEAFAGSKSFADRVYNQQFKGTIRVVRRLFSVNLYSKRFTDNFSVRYDQPLFKNKANQENSLIHEELQNTKIEKASPFIEMANGTPFYAGWDQKLRKLVITNRLLPRSISLYSRRTDLSTKKIQFTTWPIPKNVVRDPTTKKLIPYSVLFSSKNDPDNQNNQRFLSFFVSPDQAKVDRPNETYFYQTLPPNVVRTISDPSTNKVQLVIPPNRGGYIWPGNSRLQFDPESLLDENWKSILKRIKR